MKTLQIVLVAAVIVLLVVGTTPLVESTEKELSIYQTRVKLLLRILAKSCLISAKIKGQYSVDAKDLPTRLTLEKAKYAGLISRLIECKMSQTFKSKTRKPTTTPTTSIAAFSTATSSTTRITPTTTATATPTTTPTSLTTTKETTPTTTTATPATTTATPATTTVTSATTTATPTTITATPTTTTAAPTTTTATPTTTTATPTPTSTTATPTTTTATPTTTTAAPTSTAILKPQPQECLTATNYTESWRMDHSGSDIRPGGAHSFNGWACDLHKTDTQWFRLSGAAGNRMLDTCPKHLSCGTYYPLWTDQGMPAAVGVSAKVKVYGAATTNCKSLTHSVEVMRCSWDTDHDFIYKQLYEYDSDCQQAFCGMM